MKTNKSFTKRIKLTRKGKLVSRLPGKNHFNAKESRRSQLSKKRSSTIKLTNKAASRFLVNM